MFLRFLFFSTVILAVICGIALLSMKNGDPALADIPIKVRRDNYHMDNLLAKYKDQIGADYDGYRNHVMRVYTYALHILEAEKVPGDYVQKNAHVLESAIVFHDIALWTDKQLNYLEPSSARAKEHYATLYTDEEFRLLHNIIYWHHKVTPFVGEHAALVNAVRRADWIDATKGLVNYGMPYNHIGKTDADLPNKGFHYTLLTIGHRYYGLDVARIFRELSSILKW